MTKNIIKRIQSTSVLAVGFLLAAALVPAGALADSSGALYSYNLRDAASAVENTAVNAPESTLYLSGNYINEEDATRFSGNTVAGISAGYAVASEGFTLDVGTDKAFGVGAIFTADFANSTCSTDSQNITQVGRFAPGQAQVKLQLSKCNHASNQVIPECRMVGVDSPSGTAILKGRRMVQDGHTYSFTCVKNIQSSGTTTIKLTTVDLDTGQTDIKYHVTAATGIIVSDKVLSVANQYPMPAQADNSDQFNGTIAAIGYCEGIHVGAVNSCLADALADTPDEEPPVETSVQIDAGTLDDQLVAGPKWQQATWTAPGTGVVDATFNWVDPTADIRFMVTDATTGTVVMWPRSNNEPGLTRQFNAVEGHDYHIASWSKQGVSPFDVQLSW